jgi:hypothetical protein
MTDIAGFTKSILDRSRGMNLFDDLDIAETTYVCSGITEFLGQLQGGLTGGEAARDFHALKLEMVMAARKEFAKVLAERNQYFSFPQEKREIVERIYDRLLEEVIQVFAEAGPGALRGRVIEHRKRLRSLFDAPVEEKPCFYYRARFQLELFGIDEGSLLEPILDIGCGPEAGLVRYLRGLGLDARGLDRSIDVPEDFLCDTGWEGYRFENNSWGTVISHMAFSNHFIHHYAESDGKDYAFALKYREILDSLKRGGSFHYAPSLPFIESYLPIEEFSLRSRTIDGSLGVSTVVRL